MCYGCYVSKSINVWFQAWKESFFKWHHWHITGINLNSHVTKTSRHSDFPGEGQPKGSILTHELTPLEILICNKSKEELRMILSITCRVAARENCFDGSKANVL